MPGKKPSETLQHIPAVKDDDELRNKLFAAFDRFARWQKIMPREVRHGDACARSEGEVSFETSELDADSLTGYAHETLTAIMRPSPDWTRTASNQSPIQYQLEPLTHWATCQKCGAELARSSVKVSITVDGRVFTREYAL